MINNIISLISPRGSKKAILIAILILANSFVEMLGISLIYPIINVLLIDNFVDPILRYDFFSLFSNKSKKEIFEVLLFLLILSTFFKVIFQILLTTVTAKFIAFQEANISISLLKKYLEFPYIFFLKKNSSTIINELTQLTTRFVVQILNPLILLISDATLLLIVSFLLIFIDYKVFIGITIFLLLFSFFYLSIIKKKIFKWGKNINNYDEQKINIIQQIFLSLRNFKLSNNQSVFFSSYSNYSIKRGKILENYKILVDIPKLLLELIGVVLFAIFLIYLNSKNISSAEILSYIGIYTACFFRLMPVVNRMLFHLQEVRYGKNTLDRLLDIKNNFNIDKKEITISQNINYDTVKIENIFFNNVSFGYTPDKLILKNINLKISKGEKIGIVGKTGSGKTTFIDILCGLINPTAGEVMYNQKNIYSNLEVFRGSIGYVPQTVFLNDDSILRNIAFGLDYEKININKVNEVINYLDMRDFVEQLPKKLNTLIGQNGVRLSGGQRQRIGIARALYHQPNVLILDEATNALDLETENIIFENLNFFFKEMTVFIITHKLDTLKYCAKTLQVHNKEVKFL